ncbi:MAG: prepilin-type N-terminal cleavage/methylation domain-containing protein [Planctomycetota bacterium]
MPRRGWSLVELLVTLAIVALLLSLLFPALRAGRVSAQRTVCLANLRSLGQAHGAYLVDHNGRMIGTSHGDSWIEALKHDYSPDLLLRSPVDTSPHFEGGAPVNGKHRQTSYAVNRFLAPDFLPGAKTIDQVVRPSNTVHFVIKVFVGRNDADPAPTADHVHPDQWGASLFGSPVGIAATEIQTDAHGGPRASPESVAPYAYADGHAQPNRFGDVYTGAADNRFDYRLAR